MLRCSTFRIVRQFVTHPIINDNNADHRFQERRVVLSWFHSEGRASIKDSDEACLESLISVGH